MRWHHVRGRIIRDASGKPVSAHGVTGDITEQKQAQAVRERLRGDRRELRGCHYQRYDHRRHHHWNRGAKAVFGYSAEEMCGSSVARLHPPERAGELQTVLDRIARGEAIDATKLSVLRKTGGAFLFR